MILIVAIVIVIAWIVLNSIVKAERATTQEIQRKAKAERAKAEVEDRKARQKAENERLAEIDRRSTERRTQEMKEEAERAKAAWQRSAPERLKLLNENSVELAKRIPIQIGATDYTLDEAEKHFKQSAFAPFWDSIEKAALRLGELDEYVRTVIANAEKYEENKKLCEKTTPLFPIKVDSIPKISEAKQLVVRFNTIVRKAQCDFQFSVIFEQRRTNQLLIAGFTNLAQALDGLGSRIDYSIWKLNDQISQMSSTLEDGITDLRRSIDDVNSTIHEDAVEKSERDDKALEMLDNIQNRRKPS